MKTSYDFTPNGPTMTVIMLVSIKLWAVEINFCHQVFHNWFGILLFFAMMLATPFVLWWFVGRCVYWGIRLFKLDKN